MVSGLASSVVEIEACNDTIQFIGLGNKLLELIVIPIYRHNSYTIYMS
jgi:hypothetical protein